MDRIPFNKSFKQGIEDGKFVVETRNGRSVSIANFDKGGSFPLEVSIGGDKTILLTKDGKFWSDGTDSEIDLFVVPVIDQIEEMREIPKWEKRNDMPEEYCTLYRGNDGRLYLHFSGFAVSVFDLVNLLPGRGNETYK